MVFYTEGETMGDYNNDCGIMINNSNNKKEIEEKREKGKGKKRTKKKNE